MLTFLAVPGQDSQIPTGPILKGAPLEQAAYGWGGAGFLGSCSQFCVLSVTQRGPSHSRQNPLAAPPPPLSSHKMLSEGQSGRLTSLLMMSPGRLLSPGHTPKANTKLLSQLTHPPTHVRSLTDVISVLWTLTYWSGSRRSPSTLEN